MALLRIGRLGGAGEQDDEIEPSAKVHQYLLPVITQESPSRRARHETDATSEPTLGSEIEPQPIISPLTHPGKIAALLLFA